MFARKIIAASISGSLFSIVLSLILPNPFGETIESVGNYFINVTQAAFLYLLYSFPVIFVYGTATSIASDRMGRYLSRKLQKPRWEILFSFVLHCLFGLVLLWISFIAAVLFFVTDQILKRKTTHYTATQAFFSLLIPFSLGCILLVLSINI